MITSPRLFAILAGCFLNPGFVSFAEVSAAEPPPPPPASNANAVRPPALPAPAWIHAKQPANDAKETPPDVPWPGPAKTGESEFSERDAAHFVAFDFYTLPPDDYPLWRERWRAKCKASDDKEDMTMLVRLKDEETVNWLLSQMEQGQGWTADAAGILGDSGQEWLIPRLEKTLFLKPEDEPVDDHPSDGVYGTISTYSLNALVKIVGESRILTPRLKSWFKLVFGSWVPSEISAEKKQLLRKWWDMNREPFAAGNFRKLSIPPLWPGDEARAEDMDIPFFLSDLMSATDSNYVSIQLAAMQAIQDWKLVAQLNQQQAEHIGSYLKSGNSDIARAAYRLLEASGDRGIPVFAAVFADHPEKAPKGNIEKILDSEPSAAAERARCVAAIAADPDTYYFSKHKSLRLEAFPILKLRLKDTALSDNERQIAVSRLGSLAIPKDLAFLEELLKPDQPNFIRTSAAAWTCSLFTPDTMPASVRALVDDPAIGGSIKQFLADAETAVKTRRMWKESQAAPRYEDYDLTSNFGRMFTYGLHINERTFAAEQLARFGEQGITLLKLTLTMSNDAARGCAAKALLELGVGDQKEQDAFLAALVIGTGRSDSPVSDYLLARGDLHAKAMPLLKNRVLIKQPGHYHNDFAAILAANLATKDDVPFFLSLLDPGFSHIIRSTAIHAIYRLLPADEVPKSVKALINDEELGEMMRIYHYGE